MPSGQQTIAGYTAGTAASTPTYRYVYASYIDEPVMRAGALATERLYYHRNQQYSVTALTDTTGTISERYAYDAYGKLTVLAGGGTVLSGSAYGNRFTYTGREWDGEIGLYHYRARMYDPVAGRFCSRDPIGYTDSASLYCTSMSLMLVDPTGNAGTWEPRDPRHGGPHPRVLLPRDSVPPAANPPAANPLVNFCSGVGQCSSCDISKCHDVVASIRKGISYADDNASFFCCDTNRMVLWSWRILSRMVYEI